MDAKRWAWEGGWEEQVPVRVPGLDATGESAGGLTLLLATTKGIDGSCPLRERDREVTVKPATVHSRASVMANTECRNCDNGASTGAYCSCCAAHIMAKALNRFFGGK